MDMKNIVKAPTQYLEHMIEAHMFRLSISK